jgi:hypothetical protein
MSDTNPGSLARVRELTDEIVDALGDPSRRGDIMQTVALLVQLDPTTITGSSPEDSPCPPTATDATRSAGSSTDWPRLSTQPAESSRSPRHGRHWRPRLDVERGAVAAS